MRFYRMSRDDNESTAQYFTNISEAHAFAKKLPSYARGDVYIDLVEAEFKHKQITNLLNGTPPEWEVLMSFTMTQRGGLVKTTERP